MVNVIALEELHELIGCKGWAIVSIDQTRQSVLGYELLQAHTQRLGRFGGHFIQEGILAE